MLDVLSLCHIQHRLSNIVKSILFNVIEFVWQSYSYHSNCDSQTVIAEKSSRVDVPILDRVRSFASTCTKCMFNYAATDICDG